MTNKNIALTDGSTAITQSSTDNSTKIATTQFVKYFSGYLKWSNPTPATGILSITTDDYIFTMTQDGNNLLLSTSSTSSGIKNIRYQTTQYNSYDRDSKTLTITPQSITTATSGSIGTIGRSIIGFFINDNGIQYRFNVMCFSGNSSTTFLY